MSISITRYRGDTVADVFTVKDEDGVAVDITDCTFVMTVDSRQQPTDESTQLFQLTGSILSASDGTVEFVPNSTQADQTPGKYYFDIEMTAANSRVQTLTVGTYIFKQDITK